MLPKAQSYLNQTFIGTNTSDRGQCVGLINQLILDVFGLLYPLKGAVGAKDLLTCTNTRPDLFEQVKNNPNDPKQLPSVGDIFIYGATWGNGYGHTGVFEVVSSVGFTSIEQNFVANKVTRQQHNYNGLIGWIHIKNNQGATNVANTTQADLDFIYLRNLKRQRGVGEGENVYLNKDYKFVDQDIWNSAEGKTRRSQDAQAQADIINQLNTLNASVTALTALVNKQKDEIAALQDENVTLKKANEDLQAQIDAIPPKNPDEVVISKDSVWAVFSNWVSKIFK